MKKLEYYVGIDLGTTNTTVSIAYMSPTGKLHAETLDIGQVDEYGNFIEEKLLPSVLYIDENSVPYVGRYAKKMARMEPQFTASKAKRYIGEDKKYRWKMANGQYFTPLEVSSFYLKAAKNAVEKRFLNQKIDGAVITIPANFNFQQQGATREAAVLAGFDRNKIIMIPEPTAALIDFLNQEKETSDAHSAFDLTNGPKNVLVFDLGGGTCDVTIHRVSRNDQGGFDITELSISQYTELGGADFDDLIMKKLMDKWLQKVISEKHFTRQQFHELPQHVRLQIRESLLAMAEEAKVQISNKINMTVQMSMSGKSYVELSEEQKRSFDTYNFTQLMSNVPEELRVSLQITKAEIDEAIRPLLDAQYAKEEKKCIEYPIRNAIKEARVPLTFSDIDYVFLVGGMTYYPTVQERIYQLFDRRIVPLMPTNSMYTVSRGAAIYHYNRSKIRLAHIDQEGGYPSEGETRHIMPQNIYIDVVEGEPVTLIEKNTEVPFRKTFTNCFYVTGAEYSDYVTEMELELFTADDPKAMTRKFLQNAVLKFSKPVKIGSPLTIHLEVDRDRNVSVSAWLTEDETQKIHVNFGIPEYDDNKTQRIRNIQENLQ